MEASTRCGRPAITKSRARTTWWRTATSSTCGSTFRIERPAARARPMTMTLYATSRDAVLPTLVWGIVGLGIPKPIPAQQPSPGPASELRDTIDLFSTDRAALLRRYSVSYSPAQRARLRGFYTSWTQRLGRVNGDAFGIEGRVDRVLFANELRYQLALLDREERQSQEMAPWLPFGGTVMDLEESRRQMEPVDPRRTAEVLAALARQVDSAHQRARAARPGDSAAAPATVLLTRVVARRVLGALGALDQTLQRWHGFHAGYDPLFTWWTADPYQRADSALGRYARFLRETVVGEIGRA